MKALLEIVGFNCDSVADRDVAKPAVSTDVPAPDAALDCVLGKRSDPTDPKHQSTDALTFRWWNSPADRKSAQQAYIDSDLTTACSSDATGSYRTLASGRWLATPSVSISFSAHFGGKLSTDPDATDTTIEAQGSSKTSVSAKAIDAATKALDIEPVTASCSDFLKRLKAEQPKDAPADVKGAVAALKSAGFDCKAATSGTAASSGAPMAGSGAGTMKSYTCARGDAEIQIMGWKSLIARARQTGMAKQLAPQVCGSGSNGLVTIEANRWAIITERPVGDPKTAAALDKAADALGVEPTTIKCPAKKPKSTTTLVPMSQPPKNFAEATVRLTRAGFRCQDPPTQQKTDNPDNPILLASCSYDDVDFSLNGYRSESARKKSTIDADPFFQPVCRDGDADSYRVLGANTWAFRANPTSFSGDIDWPSTLKTIDEGMAKASKRLAVKPTVNSCND